MDANHFSFREREKVALLSRDATHLPDVCWPNQIQTRLAIIIINEHRQKLLEILHKSINVEKAKAIENSSSLFGHPLFGIPKKRHAKVDGGCIVCFYVMSTCYYYMMSN